jgi:hypothetical protein
MGKLTSRTLANSSAITPTTLIHVVWTGDTTDSPEGSSFKAELQQLSSIFSGSSTPFTGGTVTGSTIFTNGLTATTISAATYQNLPTDIRVTGATYSNNTFTYTNNTGGTFNTTFNVVTGLTVNGDLTITGTTTIGSISATTYQNLPVSGLTAGSNISLVNNNGNYTISVTGVTGGASIDPYNNGGSGTTISWNVSGVSTNYFATLTATTTLNLTNVRNGDYGTIILTQDSVGGRTLTLGTVNGGATTHKVANGGGGSVVLTSNANAIDILTFTYNGSTMFWTVGNDYT